MSDYKSTASQFEDFTESFIWQDIDAELHQWLDDIHNAMENVEITDTVYRQLQGSARTIRNALRMPFEIIENIKLDAENARRDREQSEEKEQEYGR